MENQFIAKNTERRAMGDKNGQVLGKNVTQIPRATVRQPLGTLQVRNDGNTGTTHRVQPSRAAKQGKNQLQQRKPLEALKQTSVPLQPLSNTINAYNNNKKMFSAPATTTAQSNINNNKASVFSVYCDPPPAASTESTMDVEDGSDQQAIPSFPPPAQAAQPIQSQLIPSHPSFNTDALRELQQQQQLAYLRNFPDFEKNKMLLMKQWQQQQQQESVDLQQQPQQPVTTKSEHDIDPTSYSDMEMDKEEEDEIEEVEEEDDDDDNNGDVVGKEVAMGVVDDGEMLLMRDYRGEIYKNCREAELRYQPRVDYMKKQFDLTHPMRSILVDWMVEVVDEYNLKRETLFLSVNYVDRFLSLMSVIRNKLQLLGAAAMFIAAKYEEIYPPDVSQFVYITDDTYTVKQILQMEQVTLRTLQFGTSPPTANFFACELLAQLSVRCVKADADDKWMHLVMLMLEQSLLEGEEFMSYKPSLLAASAVLLSNHMLHDKPCSHKIRQLTGYSIDDMSSCLRSLRTSLSKASSHPQQAIYTKFSSEKCQHVATIKVPENLDLSLL